MPPAAPLRVLALTKYDLQAASTRQRFAQYVPYLGANGVEVTLSPLLSNTYLDALNRARRPAGGEIPGAYLRRLRTLRAAAGYDLLWVQYELLPYWPGFVERWAARGSPPIVCDYDDAAFHTYDRHRRWLVRKLLGRKLEPLLSRSAAAMCGNAYLQDYAKLFCPNSIIVPTVVDTEVYRPAAASAERAAGPLVVGWLGSPTTWVNVEPLLPAILPVLKANGARLRVIGAGPRARGIDGIDAVDWSEEREIAELQGMDIGIMPLLDEPFQRGKCGYKLIQYMACGLPVVASPVGVNAEIVTDRRNGFLARSAADWADRLGALVADAALRERMGRQGRDIAEERYSLAVHRPRVLRTLRDAAGSAARADRASV